MVGFDMKITWQDEKQKTRPKLLMVTIEGEPILPNNQEVGMEKERMKGEFPLGFGLIRGENAREDLRVWI